MSFDPKVLGARIASLRDDKALSLGSVAESAGVAKSYLAKIERGEVENPGLKTLSVIAKALQVTVADLLRPAERSGRHSAGDVVFEQLRTAVPESLQTFLREQEKRDGHPVPDGVVRALALAQFRGKRPDTEQDWAFLYSALQRAVSR